MITWRAALRIARREARRAKGRSALVLAMITLPVLCLAFAAVTFDMFKLTVPEQLTRDMGTADARMWWPYTGLAEQDPSGKAMGSRGEPRERPATEAEFLSVLPPGSRVIRNHTGVVQLRTATGIGDLSARGLDVADPLARGLVTLLSGRAPANAEEVALTEQAVVRLGASIGDTVRLGDESRRWRVVGVVEFPAELQQAVLFHPAGFPLPDRTDDEVWASTWLVDSPASITWADVKRLNQSGLVVVSRAVLLDPPASESPFPGPAEDGVQAMGAGALIAGLGILEVVLLAGPAFAVGARRRRRDLALVAANGGTPAHLRRIVLADGVLLGVAGAATGIVLGIVAAFAARPLIEEHFAQFRAGGYRVYPLALAAIAGVALLTGLLAALVPAFVAARQDVVAALSGRRGVVRSRRRWLLVGVAMTGLGALVAGYGAWRVNTNLILAGVIVGELGLVLCTPSMVGLLARIGRVLPLAPRIALRDVARNRAAAAPAISAVMGAVAGSVAIGVYLGSGTAQQKATYLPSLPTGYAIVHALGGDAPRITASPERLAQAVRASLPVADVARIEVPACPTRRQTSSAA